MAISLLLGLVIFIILYRAKCYHFSIPLQTYSSNDGYNVEDLVKKGEELATLKLNELNNTLKKLDTNKNQFPYESLKHQGIYQKEFNERYFLVEEFDVDKYQLNSYWSAIATLSKSAKKRNLALTGNKGQCFIIDKKENKTYFYVELTKSSKEANIIFIPGGIYECKFFEYDGSNKFKEKYSHDYPLKVILIA